MKRYWIMFLALALVLTGCVGRVPAGPEVLSSGGNSYKTGFYGTLFPSEYKTAGEKLPIGNLELKPIVHELFELYHADVGSYLEGTIYCAEKDYESALAYYSDPVNYSYQCILGVDSDTQSKETVELRDVDTAMFEALLEFAEASDYDPFDIRHNAAIERVELPMPDHQVDTRMVFYKESTDHLFRSGRGSEYYVLNDRLYLVYQYDFGHGEYEKLIAVEVPDDISAYFVAYMKAYI